MVANTKPETCEMHEEMIKMAQANSAAIEGRVAKHSIKWIVSIFAIPTVGAILVAYGFIVSADYRYSSAHQANQNAARITLLEERTITLRTDLLKAQADIMDALREIKRDMRYVRNSKSENENR